jgi:hypothetical protein
MWFHFGSHKLGRLMLPYALLLLALSSMALPGIWRTLAIIGQIAFYGLAAIDGWIPQRWPIKRVASIARTFVVLVGAALYAPLFLAANRRGASGWATTDVQRTAVSSGADHRT